MVSRRPTRDGLVLESLPSGSTEFYESADEQEAGSVAGSLSRGPSFSGRRRSTEVGSRTSSAASERTLTTDTASSPTPRPTPNRGAAASEGSQPAVSVAAERLQEISLEGSKAGAAAPPWPQQQQQNAQLPSAAGLQQQQQQQQQQRHSAEPPLKLHPDGKVEAINGDAGTTHAAAAAGAAPTNSGAAPTTPGSSIFSVPSASAPTTGIYGIPQEMFRIRDLDAGREYSLDQRYWIKDIDTGNVYVVDAEAAAASSGGGPLGAGMGGKEGGRVTELLSGKELSINQFEDALGYFRKVPQPLPNPQHVLTAAAVAASGGSVGSSVQQAAQRSLKSFTSGATWMKASVGGMISSLGKSSPNSGSAATSPTAADGEARGGGGGALPAPVDDRQGQPTKVQVYRKSYKEFTDLRLVQQVAGHQGVVWTMKFSRNGKFLATAGQDCVIRVWEVRPNRGSPSAPSTPAESDVPLEENSSSGLSAGGSGGSTAAGGGAGGGTAQQFGGGEGGNGSGLLADPSVAVFGQRPYRVYRGHKQDVLDLSWSKTQFLLSASMDKTVRLWHISMDECLRVFKHTDFVTAIDFHPLDDKMFLSGSIDGKVRLWNIAEQRVVSWQDVHEMVTAVTYCLDGRKAVVGTMKGKCRFYTIEGGTLEYEAQLDVKNKRGQHSRGKKITGLTFLPSEPGKLLITSNDSRIRLYDGYTLRCKYKGHTNRNTQIRASFSTGGDYITCGSDDGWVYVWGTRKSGVPPSGALGGGSNSFQKQPDNPLAKEKNSSYECFQANGDIVTVAVFAPASCHRSVESMSPTVGQRHQRSLSLGDRNEGEAALAAARARGQVLVTAGYTGEIRVYENIGLPQWL